MTTNFQTVLLQTAQPGGNPMFTFLMMGGMLAVMYFFLIRPQSKKAKEQKKFADATAVGDNIVTTAGIHGRINRINEDDTLQIEISRNTFMTIQRSAISMEMTAAHRKKTEGASSVSTATPASTTVK